MKTPSELAVVMLDRIDVYSKDKGKGITRVKFSLSSLCSAAGVRVFQFSYLESLKNELDNLGWALFYPNHGEVALMRMDQADNWAKIGAV